jgi:hypothetical protein
VAGNSIKLGRDIAAQRGGHFKMVAADGEVHKESPFLQVNQATTHPYQRGCSVALARITLAKSHYACFKSG